MDRLTELVNAIVEAFDNLLCDLHRLKSRDSGALDVRRWIAEVELAADNVRGSVDAGRWEPTAAAEAAAAVVRGLHEHLSGVWTRDHWVRDRLALIAMDIDDLVGFLALLAGIEVGADELVIDR